MQLKKKELAVLKSHLIKTSSILPVPRPIRVYVGNGAQGFNLASKESFAGGGGVREKENLA